MNPTPGPVASKTPRTDEFGEVGSLKWAIARMSAPLDESWLSGVTAKEDAECMAIIQKGVTALLAALEASGRADAAQAVIDAWCDVNATVYPKTPTEMRDAMNARDKTRAEFTALRATALAQAKP